MNNGSKIQKMDCLDLRREKKNNSYTSILSSCRAKRTIYVLMIMIINICYFFLLGEKGTVWGKDTLTYIEWSYLPIRRGYVMYPWFLKFLRFIHGEVVYVEYAYIYQGVLSILIDIVLIEYIRTKYKMGYATGMVMHILILATYSYTLPEAISSHYLLTESFAIPIFLFSMYFFIRYINGDGYINLLFSIVVCILLYFTRRQLIVVLLVYFMVAVINEAIKRLGAEYSFKICIITICIITTLIGVCICGYFRYISEWKYSGENSQLIEATTGKALCLMTEDDAMLYSGQDREIYNELYQECKANDRLLANFPRSILDYDEVHRIINRNITEHETIIWNSSVRLQGDGGGLDLYAVRNLITATEICNHKAEYISIILRLMPSSLVASIFVQPLRWRKICYIFSISAYIFTMAMIICSIKYNRMKSCYLPAVTVLTIILCNSFFCNIVLYGQQRYVVYCMGLFYVYDLVMIRDLWKTKWDI